MYACIPNIKTKALMDNTCQSPEIAENPSLSIAKIDMDTESIEMAPGSIPLTTSGILPGLDLFDSNKSDDSIKACLNSELENPKPLAALSSVSLASCDPRFKVLIKDMTNSCETGDQKQQAETAKELLEFAQKEDKYGELLDPFLEQLFQVAYQYPQFEN